MFQVMLIPAREFLIPGRYKPEEEFLTVLILLIIT